MNVFEVLGRTQIFKDFTESGLKALAEIARPRALPAGAEVFAQGAEGDSLFVVVSGGLRLSCRGPDGSERELALLGPGAHLGDLGLLAKTVRLVRATATVDSEVLELVRRDFFRLAQQKPITCFKLAAVIAGELAHRVEENREALSSLLAKG